MSRPASRSKAAFACVMDIEGYRSRRLKGRFDDSLPSPVCIHSPVQLLSENLGLQGLGNHRLGGRDSHVGARVSSSKAISTRHGRALLPDHLSNQCRSVAERDVISERTSSAIVTWKANPAEQTTRKVFTRLYATPRQP